MKNAAINGVIGGIVLIALNLIISFVSPKLNYQIVFAIVSSSIIQLIFMFRTNSQEKKSTSSAFGFGEALIPAMGCYLIMSLLFGIFSYINLNVNPGELELMKEAQIEYMESTMRLAGANDDLILQQVDEIDDEFVQNITSISATVLGWIGGLIFPGFLLGAIVAGFTRKKTTAA